MPKKSALSWKQAILKVLKEHPRVLKYYDIADIIVNEGLRTSGEIGATPAITVNSILHSDKLKKEVTCVGRGEYILTEHLDKNPSLASTSSSVPAEEEDNVVDDALITAFGRFWDRKLWEENNKQLLGGSSKTNKAPSVDFSEHAGIYLLHKGYEVIYVGQALKLKTRLDAHTTNDKRNRWDNFSWFSLQSFDKEAEKNGATKSFGTPALLDTLEALLIETLGPERNKKVGNGFDYLEFEQLTEKEYLQRLLGAKP